MNISLNELKILILGNLPIKKNGWIKKVISKKEYRIFKGSTELVFLLSSNGNIKSMEKFTGGLLEYRAEIPFYKTFKNKDYPRKLIIKDFYSKNEWKIIISEVQKLPYKINPIKLNPPDNMSKFLGY